MEMLLLRFVGCNMIDVVTTNIHRRTEMPFFIIMLFTLLGTFYFYSSLEVIEEKKIFGLWEGVNNGKELMFRFEIGGTCVLGFKDIASDTTRVLNGDFKIDLTKKPITLSITNIPNINHPFHTIIEFIGDNKIKLAEFSPRWKVRPISFDRNTFISLNRVN